MLFVCLTGVAVHAQDVRATLTGRVADPTGAGIAGASVTATNTQTNEVLTASTGDDGNYTIPLLRPGSYNIRAEAAGFKSALRDAIQLFVGDKRTVDFNLEIGERQETMTVSSAAPLLDEATATRGGVIENLRVTELPLNGRNPFMLSNLTPGVQFNGNPQFVRPFDNGDNANFSINGGVRQTNEFVIDGAPDNASPIPPATVRTPIRTSPTFPPSTPRRSLKSSPTSTTRSTGARAAA